MGNYKYVTNRMLANKAGEPDKGNMRVLVPNGSDTAQVAYRCPECGNQEQLTQPWKRPFSVKCSKCGYLMKLPKLKGKK